MLHRFHKCIHMSKVIQLYTFILCSFCTSVLEKEMATNSSTLSWRSHGGRSLVGYSPWGCKESDTSERLHFHFVHQYILIALF